DNASTHHSREHLCSLRPSQHNRIRSGREWVGQFPAPKPVGDEMAGESGRLRVLCSRDSTSASRALAPMPLQIKCPRVQHAGELLDRRTNLLPGLLLRVEESLPLRWDNCAANCITA